MLRRLEDLEGFRLSAKDGELGKVKDFLFDEHEWTVRYFIADTGGWLRERLVLISPASFSEIDWDRKQLAVDLTKEKVEQSPPLEAAAPVSRRQEAKIAEYYAWPSYWGGMGYAAGGLYTPEPVPVPEQKEAGTAPEDSEVTDESHLRSVKEVDGYNIAAEDGHVGHVTGFIVEEPDLAIRYLVVDTRNWLPGRRVLISPRWVKSVEWFEGDVSVRMTRQQVKDSPKYDHDQLPDREYEQALHDHYEAEPYWNESQRK